MPSHHAPRLLPIVTIFPMHKAYKGHVVQSRTTTSVLVDSNRRACRHVVKTPAMPMAVVVHPNISGIVSVCMHVVQE